MVSLPHACFYWNWPKMFQFFLLSLPCLLSYLLILLISWHILISFPFSLASVWYTLQPNNPREETPRNQPGNNSRCGSCPNISKALLQQLRRSFGRSFHPGIQGDLLNPKTDLGIFTMDFGPQIIVKFGDHHKISKDEIYTYIYIYTLYIYLRERRVDRYCWQILTVWWK